MPQVSVVIATYNRADLLPEAVRSVLAQPVDLELIIVDDGSTDDTAAVVAPFLADPRVRYLPQANVGLVGQVRNTGARLAQGEFLAFLDSDDRYTPDALPTHLRAFAQQPDLGLTVAGYEYVTSAGASRGVRAPWLEGGDLTLAGWLFNCYSIPGAVLVRRSWFERSGGFNTEVTGADDWDLFLQLAVRGCPMAWVRAFTCLYRLHAGNSFRRVARHLNGCLRVMAVLFNRPDFPAALVPLQAPALAWVYVIVARMAVAAEDPAQASEWLAEALRRDPSLSAAQRAALLETWLTPPFEWAGPPEAFTQAAVAALPPALRPTPAALRRLLARQAMQQFFKAQGLGQRPAAGRALRAALRHDPTWLANRGVLAFLARGLLPARKPA